jgi:hypothetical protein
MSDLLTKLQVKPAQSIAVVGGAPEGADGWNLSTDPEAADAVLVYVADSTALAAAADLLRRTTDRGALCWVAYPKGGQLGTDLNRDRLRAAVDGIEPVRQIAVDDVWSALRFKPV